MSGLKRILFGLGMFSLGGAAGCMITRRVLRKQYQEDVADIQDFYQQKLEEFGVMEENFELSDDKDPSEDEEEMEDIEFYEPHRTDISGYPDDVKKRILTDYTKPSMDLLRQKLQNEGISVVVGADGAENLGDIENDEEEEEYTPQDDPEYEAEVEANAEEFARRRSEAMKRGDPYVISADEYRDGPEDYDHQVLYYYAEDRVLCEDDDSQVDDEEGCVGFDYEDVLDIQTTCWVRNDRLRVLYEIHRIDDSFKKAVLGIIETPREREFRIQGRRKRAMDER